MFGYMAWLGVAFSWETWKVIRSVRVEIMGLDTVYVHIYFLLGGDVDEVRDDCYEY